MIYAPASPTRHASPCRRPAGLRWLVWTLLIACGYGLPSSAYAQVRQGDTLWEVSSRGLSDCPSGPAIPNFAISQVSDCRWLSASLESLLAELQLDQRPIVVYVHGNWMPTEDARQRALQVYQELVQTSCCESICFVAFSWPSERREGFAKDVIGKKSRLDADSYYLAQLLNQLPGSHPLGILGYSFGGPVACGALHLLNGGNLCGYSLAGQLAERRLVRVSLIAPAFDRTALTACGRYHHALDGVDQLVNLFNSSDPVLKRFRFFDRDTSPIAAGFAGILEERVDSPLHPNPKIVQYDCRSIGRTHAELSYLQCGAVVQLFYNVIGR